MSRRFLRRATAGWRIHRRGFAVIVGCLLIAVLFISRGIAADDESFEFALWIVLAGAALTTVGKTVVDMVTRAEAYRQGAYSERAKAVQHTMNMARDVRERAVDLWRARHGLYVERPWPPPWSSESYAENARAAALVAIRNDGFANDVWIGKDGVNAVRAFNASVEGLDPSRFGTEAEFLEVFNEIMDKLRDDLLVGLGFWFD